MNTVKYEVKIMLLICILCAGIFINLALIADPVSTTALAMGGVLIVAIIVPRRNPLIISAKRIPESGIVQKVTQNK